jgi:hypothetical protein
VDAAGCIELSYDLGSELVDYRTFTAGQGETGASSDKKFSRFVLPD